MGQRMIDERTMMLGDDYIITSLPQFDIGFRWRVGASGFTTTVGSECLEYRLQSAGLGIRAQPTEVGTLNTRSRLLQFHSIGVSRWFRFRGSKYDCKCNAHAPCFNQFASVYRSSSPIVRRVRTPTTRGAPSPLPSASESTTRRRPPRSERRPVALAPARCPSACGRLTTNR